MRRAIIGKAAGEVAGLEEIIDEGLQHVVEGIFSKTPVFQEIADIGAAAFAAGADQRWGDLQLVE